MSDDYSATLAAKSDQLNADDLAGGPVTVQILGGTVRTGEDQPVTIRISHGYQPWKPCKGMRRALAEIAGSTRMAPWVGMWVTLYRDTGVLWAGKPAGGIRLAAVDERIMPKPTTIRVRVSRQGYTPYNLTPIPDGMGRLDAVLTDAGMTIADADRWRQSVNRGPVADLSPHDLAGLADWLAADSTRLAALRLETP